jgi:hypothetical protein
MRHRHLYLSIGCVVAVAALLATDPDKGMSTGLMLLGILTCVLAVLLAHVSRKALHDYPEADMQALFRKAAESSTGSGLALIAIALMFSAFLGLFGSKVHAAEYIPHNATVYAPLLKAEQVKFWSTHSDPKLLAGLVEQESCLSLTHSKCWSPMSSLKTAREEGAGVGQITRAYRADGSLRFDSLADMRQRYDSLREWNWGNVYRRPDLQFRALVLMSHDNYQAVHKVVIVPQDALAFADAAYNGGLGGVSADRRLCGLSPKCDSQKWFGNVEHTCAKSHAAIYGTSNPCSINRTHVHNVMLVRSHKYSDLMQNHNPL